MSCFTIGGVLLVLLPWFPSVTTKPPPHEMLQGADIGLLSKRPGYQLDFKINVSAGKQECFYQKLNEGTSLSFLFEVVSETERNVDFVLFSPEREILDKYEWKRRGVSEMRIREAGIYGFCLNNSMGQLSSKLIYIYISISISERWKKYYSELKEIDASLKTFIEHLRNLEKQVSEMTGIQTDIRQHQIYHSQSLRFNNALVQNWSFTACAVVVITGALQAYFLRYLLKARDPKPIGKAKA